MRHNPAALVFLAALTSAPLTSLAQPEKTVPKPEQTAPQGVQYFCPMKCEGEKTYDAMGRCPVCKMKLKPVAPPAPTGPSATLDAPKAADLKPNQPIDLTFKITSAPNAVPAPHYDLLLLSSDLSWTDHAQAGLENSRFVLRTELPKAGEYSVVVLEEGKALKPLPHGKFTVPGEASTPKPTPAPGSTVDAGDGYKVAVFLKHTAAKKDASLEFTVTREGDQPVNLKAGTARLYLLTADLTEGAAVKAEPLTVAKPVFKVELPKPAQYRAILEFDHEGKTRRALCTVSAT